MQWPSNPVAGNNMHVVLLMKRFPQSGKKNVQLLSISTNEKIHKETLPVTSGMRSGYINCQRTATCKKCVLSNDQYVYLPHIITKHVG